MNIDTSLVSLSDLITIKHGYAFKGEYFVENKSTYQLVTPGNFAIGGGFQIKKEKFYDGPIHEEYVLKKNDLVVTMTDLSKDGDTLGYSALIPDTKDTIWLHNQRVGLVLIKEPANVDSIFLSYLMRTQNYRAHILSGATGSTVKHTSPSKICEYKIYLPTIDVQKKIASILNSIDKKISSLKEINQTLEAIAQAIFKSWFVDFDPVHSKQQSKECVGIDEVTADLFPDSFIESELGLIPKGWQVGKVSELGEVICGKTPSTSDKENYDGNIPFITIPDMHNNIAITSTNRYLSKKGADSQHKKYLRKGSICVSCIATPGLVSKVTVDSQSNQQINSVVPDVKWGDDFVLFLLRSIGEAVKTAGSGGSIFHNLNTSNFREIKIVLPNAEISTAFNQLASIYMEKIVSNQHQIKTLIDLRDTLLPRLISGKIDLSNIEEPIEGIA